jgi:hypothetical protein
VVLIDERSWRGLDDSILGDAQEAWFFEALRASDATFTHVVRHRNRRGHVLAGPDAHREHLR